MTGWPEVFNDLPLVELNADKPEDTTVPKEDREPKRDRQENDEQRGPRVQLGRIKKRPRSRRTFKEIL